MGDIYASLSIVFYGLIVSFVVSVVACILASTLWLFERLFQLIAMPLRYTPIAALVPMLISIIGIGEPLGVAVIILGCAPSMSLQFVDIVKSEPKNYSEFFHELGLSKLNSYLIFRFMGSIPRYLRVLRVMAGWAWSYVILAEIVGGGKGLGFAIDQARRFGDSSAAWMKVFIVAVIGFFLDSIFGVILKFWKRDGT